VRKLRTLGNLIARLEERYQAPVDVGQAERELADRIWRSKDLKVPFVWLRPPRRLI